MSIILGLLTILTFIALIIGIIKPSIVLKWDKNPTRLKVFGYWILSLFVIGIISSVTTSDEDIAQGKINIAKSYIEDGEFELAKSSLNSIKKDNELYLEAQVILNQADSLLIISEEESRLVRIEEEKIEREENKGKLKEQLERELKSLSEGVNFSEYRGSVESLQMELVLFGTWANIVSEGEASDDEEIRMLAKNLKSKVSRIQTKEFPLIRKDYAKTVASKMWENDIDVYSSGTGHRRINFTGGLFAANKNKQDFQNQLQEALKMFRFTQARYRWYKGQDEYTYWEIEPQKDRDMTDFDK